MESILFTIIMYWLAGLRPTMDALSLTILVVIFTINVSTACGKCFCLNSIMDNKFKVHLCAFSCTPGCFFSAVYQSVPLAMAYLVPFDYILMITMGPFIKLRYL